MGATSGTGLLIAQQLLQRGFSVRIVARDPDKVRRVLANRVSISRADVTDPQSVRQAIAQDYQAIFFTVAATGGIDGRALFGSRTLIREVTYQGLVNVVRAAQASGCTGRLVLASVVGADRSSAMIKILDKIKPGLQRNLADREVYLRTSGLDYAIVRAPILSNGPSGETRVQIRPPTEKLIAGSRISRGDLARVMILASQGAGACRKTFEVFATNGVPPSNEQLLSELGQILPER